MEQTQTQLTEAQAIVVVEQGVKREVRKDSERTLDYCKDAVKLLGYNVRKLAQKCEVRAEDRGEVFNADSYQSNISNANGIMALFDYDLDAFEVWLKQAESKSLSKIFKQFRELFADPKPAKPKPEADEAGEGSEDKGSTEPLVNQVLAALQHLSYEEIQQVQQACSEILTAVPAAA
ncbi:MAG: hypothetical protein LC687_06525 [Actinobacteria bacterium]|nr:hypothetical protein [Actinomycetota bacterium]MCA1807483.1 hypothetical protein [Actinomycetota bacterium]